MIVLLEINKNLFLEYFNQIKICMEIHNYGILGKLNKYGNYI